MKIDYKKERQILKKIITTNEISSLININNTTIKDITVLGIGGSHIYKANCKNLNIEKYTFYEIDEGNFFENIQNFIKEEKEFNTIFSYPFIPKKNNGYIDAFFKNNTVISKKLPFKKEDFLLSYKLNRLTNIVNDACASNLFNIYTNKGYEIYLSLLSGTGINISYSQNNSPINTEFGNIKIP